MEIIKKFTQIRNIINEREDKLLAQIDDKFSKLFLKEDDNIIKKSEKLPNIIKSSLESGKLINEKWDNDNILNSNINDCIKIENSIKTINDLSENIEKYNNQKITLKFKDKNDNYNIILKNINEFGDIIDIKDNSCIFKFKFKNGKNYILSKNGCIATKNEGGNDYNCTIIGKKEIPKNKISKWKIKLNKLSNNGNIFIGIGPDNPNNKNDFYKESWTFVCSNSKLLNRSGSYSDYNGHSEILKEGDILEVIADRITGKLSFAVNDFNFGIAFKNIPKEDTLYPIIIMQFQAQIIVLI